MNKKGFTLIELLATLVIIVIVMGIVLPSASRISQENQEKIYHEYENMMEEYAIVSPLKGQDIIKLSELEELTKVKNDCVGYVKLTNTNPINYEAYIKCPKCGLDSKYKTTLFDESKVIGEVDCENE